jgi:hypothetical protein
MRSYFCAGVSLIFAGVSLVFAGVSLIFAGVSLVFAGVIRLAASLPLRLLLLMPVSAPVAKPLEVAGVAKPKRSCVSSVLVSVPNSIIL